jgi:hypothetical protein
VNCSHVRKSFVSFVFFFLVGLGLFINGKLLLIGLYTYIVINPTV